MKILKCSDLIKLTPQTENKFSITVKPLSVSEKMEVASKTKMNKGEEVPDNQAQALLCIKYAVKKIEGIKNHDDSEYEPTFIDGVLDESSADDILSLLSDTSLLVPVILSANKNINQLQGVEVEVNPKP
jgi:hypothetical protein